MDTPITRPLQRLLQQLHWDDEHFPQLASASVLIWLSVLGFLYASAAFSEAYYEMPYAVGTWVSLVLGVGLLGGYSATWQAYPYDLPNAFVFLAALYAIRQRALWWPVIVIAAAYSKETAVLLIPAYAILDRGRFRSVGYWTGLAYVAIAYASVHLAIQAHWHNAPPPEGFWFPARNVAMLVKGLLHYWWFAALGLVAIPRLRALWPAIPADLRLLLSLGLCLLVGAFFKGWVEERRGYFEIYPVIGLIVAQWVFREWGREDLFRPKGR